MQPSVGGQPIGRGRTVFQWLEGGAFLVQHADAEPIEAALDDWVANLPFPLVTVIGLDDASERFACCMPTRVGLPRLPDEPWRWRLEAVAGRAGVLPALHRHLQRRHAGVAFPLEDRVGRARTGRAGGHTS
jgi:hypothetical protein